MSSPFFQKGTFGHNPFVYKNEVYRFNPTVVFKKEALPLLTAEERLILNFESPKDWSHPESSQRIPDGRPIIVGIVSKVFDDPFLGIEVSENSPEAEQFRRELIDMNGIEFHRTYYNYFIKEIFEGVMRDAFGVSNPDDLSEDDFLFLFCLNFFASYLIGDRGMVEEDKAKVKFFKKAFDDPNAFDYEFLASAFPNDREDKHFLVWEK